MKKICLVLVLAIAVCCGVFAGSTEEIQFKQYVELTKKSTSNPKGMSVTADEQYRIIYTTMPTPANSTSLTPQAITELRARMIKQMSTHKNDVKVIKDLKISMVFTFITSDKKVFCIGLSYKDF